MADVAGPGGNITLPTGFNIHLSAWAASLSITTVENTGFAEVGNRTYLPTAQTMSGSFVGTGMSASAPVPAANLGATPAISAYSASGTLTSYANGTYTGTMVITNLNYDRPHDGKLTITGNFVFSGAITPVWS